MSNEMEYHVAYNVKQISKEEAYEWAESISKESETMNERAGSAMVIAIHPEVECIMVGVHDIVSMVKSEYKYVQDIIIPMVTILTSPELIRTVHADILQAMAKEISRERTKDIDVEVLKAMKESLIDEPTEH